MQFYSHPSVFLKDHLRLVGLSASKFIEVLNIKNKNELANLARNIGLCHDFGKYTSFFQNHLLRSQDYGSKTHHSLLSALLATHRVEDYLKNYPLSEEKINKFIPLIAYLVIHRHHGDLRSPEEIIPSRKSLSDYPVMNQSPLGLRNEIQALRYQIEDLRKEPRFSVVIKEMEDNGISGIKDFLSEDRIIDVFKSLDSSCYDLIEKNELLEKDRLEIYFLSLLLFSSLIDADKRLAAKVSEIPRKNIQSDIVDSYIHTNFKNVSANEINKMRDEIYRRVLEKVTKMPLDKKILTFTAPTGSGKTLAVLSAALKLRERFLHKPRIIYCLPFVNIIEQNYDVFYKVFSAIPDFGSNLSSYLLKHHHLANLEYKEGNEKKPLDEALLLTESWESEIIVTTFVQFLHTVIGFKNSFLKKMHNIAGSIIILDEVQNIPIEYWGLTGRVLKGLTEILGCTVIQMTATRPLIFSKEETIELLDSNESYFKQLNRVTLKPRIKEEMTEQRFIEWFKHSPEKSYLIVVNTISISISIYNALKEKLKEKVIGFAEFENGREIPDKNLIARFLNIDQQPIIYLSTNIIPKQRMKRIEFLKEFLPKGGKPILIATQVVEAGVDLDFQEAIRDIGPLDSIVQVAGRCNRNDNPQKGEVTVIKLSNGGAEHVYGKVHPFIAFKLLVNPQIEEKEFRILVERYYQEIKQRISDTQSSEIWNSITNLCFHHDQLKSVSDFQLIKEKGDFVDVFVEIDDDAKVIRERFLKEVLSEKEFVERQRAYLSLRKSVRDYLLSIRRKRIEKNPPFKMEKGDMFFVPLSQIKDFYDLETGYKAESGTSIY